jgi:Poly(ADP-ribose) polymerase, regulatory domain
VQEELGGVGKGKDSVRLVELSSKFYSFIPHKISKTNLDSLIIDSYQKLEKKLDLLTQLEDVKHLIESD